MIKDFNYINNGVINKQVNANELEKYLNNGWVVGRLPTTSGRVWIHKDGKNTTIDRFKLEEYLSNGWIKGKIPSKKELNTVRVHKDGITKSIQKEELDSYLANGWFKGVAYHYRWITNDTEERWTDIDLPDGWKEGRLYKNPNKIINIYNENEVLQIKKVELHKYEKLGYKYGKGKLVGLYEGSTKNTMWIHKDTDVKLINQSEFKIYLDLGWHSGKIHSDSKIVIIDNNDKLKLVSKDEFYSYYKTEGWIIAKSGDCHGMSSRELKFAAILQENTIHYEYGFRLENKNKFYVYDFKINNILVEINDSYTHSVNSNRYNNGLSPDYHFSKTKFARDLGYTCINFWDWDSINTLIHYLTIKPQVFIQDCTIKEVDYDEARNFLTTYHFQGYDKDSIRLGLFYHNKLVSIMTFDRLDNSKKYKLIRYCYNCYIVDDFRKLFKYFISKYNPQSIIAYCDLSKFSGDLYEKLGFTKNSISIYKHWYNPKNQKHIVDNFKNDIDIKELIFQNDFIEIYDCGQIKYIWSN